MYIRTDGYLYKTKHLFAIPDLVHGEICIVVDGITHNSVGDSNGTLSDEENM